MGLVLWVNFEDFEAAFGEAGGWRAARPGKAELAGDAGASRTSECCGIWGVLAFPFLSFFFFSPSLHREHKILCS